MYIFCWLYQSSKGIRSHYEHSRELLYIYIYVCVCWLWKVTTNLRHCRQSPLHGPNRLHFGLRNASFVPCVSLMYAMSISVNNEWITLYQHPEKLSFRVSSKANRPLQYRMTTVLGSSYMGVIACSNTAFHAIAKNWMKPFQIDQFIRLPTPVPDLDDGKPL